VVLRLHRCSNDRLQPTPELTPATDVAFLFGAQMMLVVNNCGRVLHVIGAGKVPQLGGERGACWHQQWQRQQWVQPSAAELDTGCNQL
jgi:hypothetical protein